MMDIIEPAAAERGYTPDAIVTPDEMPRGGRPHPWMIFRDSRRAAGA